MATSRAVAAVRCAKVVGAVADAATYERAAKQAGYATRSGAYKAFYSSEGAGELRCACLSAVHSSKSSTRTTVRLLDGAKLAQPTENHGGG